MSTPKPIRHPLLLPIGIDWEQDFIYKDSGGNLVNLTGYNAKMQVRADYVSTSPVLLELSTTNGRITLGGALGTIKLAVSQAVTEALTAGSYVYDLELASGASTGKIRLLEGPIVFTPEVTR